MLSKSAATGQSLVAPPPARMPTITEDMNIMGEETEEDKEFSRDAKLRKLALQLGKLYPEERGDRQDGDWTRDFPSPPSMIYL